MDTTVCLVRHGETDWNNLGKLQGRDGIPLNERGMAQSELAAAHLERDSWDLIVTSPMRRARQTAQVIADRLGLPYVEVMEQFTAREPGAEYGLTKDERAARFPDRKAPGAEPRAVVMDRCMRGLNALAESYPGARVIVVAHREGINMMLSTISRGEVDIEKTEPSPGSVSLIRRGQDGEWHIESHNVSPEPVPGE